METFYLIVTAELVCAVFMAFVLMGLFSVTKATKAKTLLFRKTVGSVLLALLADALAFIFERLMVADAILYGFEMASFAAADLVAYFISSYIYAELCERKKFRFDHTKVMLGICISDAIVILVSVLSRTLFTVKGGVITYGPMVDYVGILPSLCELYLIVLILHNRRLIGTKATVVFNLYLLFPFLAVVQLVIVQSVSFIYVACAFSVIFIYVMILSGELSEVRTKEQLIAEISILDNLTGLKNRNAFDGALDDFQKEERLGLVYCDINALKKINDSLGKEEGDLRIRLLADLLKRSFEVGSVYRLGGDDFYVVVRNAKRVEFEGLVNTFMRKVAMNGSFAAVGYAYGSGKDIFKLLSEAEDVHAVDKLGYYQANNIRRG